MSWLRTLRFTALVLCLAVPTAAYPTRLDPGQSLAPGESLESPSGRHRLSYQTDGNLVIYGPGGGEWASNTAGTPAGSAVMQGDGNFVVYDADGNGVWSTGTHGNPGAYAVMLESGNFAIMSADGWVLWWTDN
jgi:hypothetical protein